MLVFPYHSLKCTDYLDGELQALGKQCRLLHLAWFGADQNSQAVHVHEVRAPCVYLPIYLLIIFFMCVRY